MKNGSKKAVLNTLEREIQAVCAIKKNLGRDFFRAVGLLKGRKGKIVLVGVGKSAHIGLKMVGTFTSLGHSSSFLHPVDALHGDTGIVSDGDVLVAISFSGESVEVVRIVKYIKKNFNVKIVSITGNGKSSLAKISDAVIKIDVKDEGSPLGLAPMASTTATLVVGDLLSTAITDLKNFKPKNFAKFHPGGSLGLQLKKVKSSMRKGKKIPLTKDSDYFLKALKEVNDKKLGVTGVVDRNRRLVGVVTDGDVRRFMLSGIDFKKAVLRKIMTKNPKTIFEHESLKEALSKMENFKITNLFVLNKQKQVIGIIHIHDIVQDNIV